MKGWSNAARHRAGQSSTPDVPCWGCGVHGCGECGPDPDTDIPTGTDTTDETDQPGGLYSDKCEDCRTGVSCEEAGSCLFEG